MDHTESDLGLSVDVCVRVRIGHGFTKILSRHGRWIVHLGSHFRVNMTLDRRRIRLISWSTLSI